MKRKFMWTRFFAVTALAVTALTSTSYDARAGGTRDLASVFNPVAVAQVFMGLNTYKNHCAVLPAAAGEVHHQMEQMTMDQPTLNKMKTQLAMLKFDHTGEAMAKFCTELEPTVQQLDKAAAEMPVTVNADPLDIERGRLTKQHGNMLQNITVTNNTKDLYRIVIVDCDFYDGDELVGAGKGSINNLPTGKTKGAQVYGMQISNADRVSCSLGTTLK
jgi:hypothetical protein